MPVYSLEGTPGSGKSLYMVQKIIPDFLRHRAYDGSIMPRHIYTNIEGLNPELLCMLAGFSPSEAAAMRSYFHQLGEVVDENGHKREDKRYLRYFYYEQDSIEWIKVLDEKGKPVEIPDPDKAQLIPYNSLVIIDELQNYFGGRDFATRYSRDCVDCITKNRHFGWSIWWASQNVEAVDITFRRNTEQVWFLEKLENYGQANSASIKVYEGYMAGNKTMVDPMIKRKYTYDKKFYQCYKSYIGAGVQEKRYKGNVFLNNKPLMIVLGIMLLCIVFTLINGNPLDKMVKKPSPTAKPQPAALMGFSPKAQAQAEKPVPSSSSAAAPSNIVCIDNSYTHAGIEYVVINGKSKPKDKAEKYEICFDNAH